jgi:hypothetical protein
MLAIAPFPAPTRPQTPPSTLHSVIDLLQDPKYLSSQTSEYRDVLAELMLRSGSQLALNINNGIRANSINFLLLSPDINERTDVPVLLFTPTAQSILHNCNYVGLDSTIVCAQDFVDTFFNTYLKKDANVHYLPGKETRRHDALNVSTAHRAFLFWVLGHELGHLAHGDLDSQFGSPFGMEQPATADELQQDKELRADSYCADLISKPALAVGHTTYAKVLIQDLITLANEEVITRHLTKGEGPGLLKYYSQGDTITYEEKGQHPEYVIRATRLLKIIADLTHDRALTAMTESFEQHLKLASPPPTH